MNNYNNRTNNQKLFLDLISQNETETLAAHCRELMVTMDTNEIIDGEDTDYLREVLKGGLNFKPYSLYSDLEAISEFRDREYCHEFFFIEDFNAYQVLTNFLDIRRFGSGNNQR